MADESFTRQMRVATREIHAVSDALVNAKLFFALSDSSVWSEGLLIFYEIFRFLEEAMRDHKDRYIGQLLLEGLERTEAFQKDLMHYLGPDWDKNCEVREEVASYLLHLHTLKENDPDLLIAYVYHLYMGLLSGGQILTRKLQLKSKLFRKDCLKIGYAITDFGDESIYSLKKNMKDKMEEIAGNLSDEKKSLLIEESKRVFEWNNRIIRTVKGTNRIILEKLIWAFGVIALIYLIILFLRS